MAFGSEQWMYSSGGFYPHEIGNSVRIDTNSYLARTPSSASNRKTFTWSGWVKRCNLSAIQSFFSVGSSSSSVARMDWQFSAGNQLQLYFNPTGSSWIRVVTTTARYRDPSSWYHIVIAVDTTQATASNRTKLYVNGEQVTDFTSDGTLAQNTDLPINNTVEHNIGRYQSDANAYLDGYTAEVNFVDGQALDPTGFGETKSGMWIPKKYTGSYGTNGYYLDFATRATDPIDASGNGNNWGSVNVTSSDWMLDTPTNNFATLNPLFLPASGAVVMSEGNLKVTNTGANAWKNSVSSMSIPRQGKWYAEFLAGPTSGNQYNFVGLTSPAVSQIYSGEIGATDSGVGYYSGSGNKYLPTGQTAYGSTYAAGDIISIVYDADANQATFYKNNVSQGAISVNDAEYCFGAAVYSSADKITCNFGQDSSFAGNKTAQGNTDANGIGDFYYAPPADYLALCSANLPAPAIDPAKDDIPADYFNPVLYTGNGSTQSITGVGFQPDLVWVKKRSTGGSNGLTDVVRGTDKLLFSDSNIAEITFTGGIGSFDSDGFSLASGDGTFNAAESYVSWNWKAGGAAVANTDGTIASQVSANTKSGFSIVTYTGNGTTGSTVGHGLSRAPDVIIAKSRSATGSWPFHHTSLGNSSICLLEATDSAGNYQNAGYARNPNSTTFELHFTGGGGNINASGTTYVAYCFHSVEGFSKFGSYTGNFNTDGPFVYTGFRPAYVLVKNASAAEWWTLIDNKRVGYNETNSILSPNESSAEYAASGGGFDLTSNGFKVRGTSANFNGSGNTILYMAFAEQPFKYANAR